MRRNSVSNLRERRGGQERGPPKGLRYGYTRCENERALPGKGGQKRNSLRFSFYPLEGSTT
jgi:hypothetical protein